MFILAMQGHAENAVLNNRPSVEQDSTVRRIVFGIISFTHWPAPRTSVRLCIVGETRFTLDRTDAPPPPSEPTIVVRKTSVTDPTIGVACDALYMGELSNAERKQIDASRAGQPVLTLSESDGTCTQGAMFCLHVDGYRVRFDMNLDSVARSGVRVSPKVLELALKRSAP